MSSNCSNENLSKNNEAKSSCCPSNNCQSSSTEKNDQVGFFIPSSPVYPSAKGSSDQLEQKEKSLDKVEVFVPPKKTDSSCCSSKSCSDTTEAVSTYIPQPSKPVSQDCCSSGSCETEKPLEDADDTVAVFIPSPQKDCCDDETCESLDQSKQADSRRQTEAKGTEVEYLISGMDCPSCAQTIVKKVSKFKGINRCDVNFSSAKMTVDVSQESQTAKIEQAVKQLGFQLTRLDHDDADEYVIEGMDCTACAGTIEKHLRKLNGVQRAEVNFATAKLKIEHHLTQQNIVEEVKKVGYKAAPYDQESIGSNTANSWHGLGYVIVSGIALVIGLLLSYLTSQDLLAIVFYTISIVVGGHKAFRSAWYAILSKSLDMNVLMSSAAIGAVLINQWAEGASVVFLFALGTALQTRTIEKTRASIRNLMKLAPDTALIKQQQSWQEVPVKTVTIGQVILVKPAERIPLDGIISQGQSSINQAPITGESMPIDKGRGETVYAGSINGNGTLEIEVTQTSKNTALARIIHLVEEAQSKKSLTQSFVERFATIYTTIVFVVALLTIIITPLLFSGEWAVWIYRGLELLVVACPCALVISTPVAIVSAIGNAAHHGVLLKGGISLEKLADVDTVVFDKTGTLTEGKPVITVFESFSDLDTDRLLTIVNTIEAHSNHPLARAICLYADEKQVKVLNAFEYQTLPGKGASAVIEGETWFAGNLKLFSNIADHISNRIQVLQNQGATLIILGTVEQVHAVFAVADQLRPTSIQTIQNLKALGIKHTEMLTGDNAGVAAQIALKANVEFKANLMPEDKVTEIQRLQQDGYSVAMVGDGINDAPALTQANVGISMGGAGTDSAIEVSDVVLMSDNIEQLPHAMRLSKKTKQIIKQNIIFSLVIKFIALALIFPGWLSLWMAVLSDTGAAVLVILNSLRLLNFKR